MTYFTSDQHFGHFNIIRLCGRPFETVEEMDEALLSKWNGKVKADDTVYILGDLFFRAAKVEPILKALNGHKHLIVGNHDHTWMKRVEASDYFASVQTLKEVEADGRVLTLCHYPMLSYPQARRGYMVYGHIHNNVSVNNFEPVTFGEMVANNRAFIASHADVAKQNPLMMFCLEA